MYSAYDKTTEEIIRAGSFDAVNGLTEKEAERSRNKYGVNSFVKQERESALRRIWEALTEPMLIMLIIAAVITLVVNITRYYTGKEYNFLECAGIFAAIILSAAITVITEGKSAAAFEALNRINEDTLVKAVRDGRPQLISQKDVVVGDVLLVETGDKIVADGRILEGNDLSADESALTGESMPVSKDAAFVCVANTPVAERKNMLYSGCFVSSGTGRFLVTAVGNDTEFGKIAGALSSIEKTTTPLQEKLDRLGKLITVLGISAASLVFVFEIIQFILNGNISLDTVSDAFITSIVLIVAAVPEGLPTIVAVSLALNIIKMTGENALVKKMTACETIGCINVICTDKTGTLTKNRMTVSQIYSGGKLLSPECLNDRTLLNNFCINGSANISKDEDGEWTFIGNPTECSLLAAAHSAGWDYAKVRSFADVLHVYPFSSQNKDMLTVVKEDDSVILYVKGNPEKLLSLSCNIGRDEEKKINGLIEEFQKKAGRILAFAHKKLDSYNNETATRIEKDLHYDGFAVISDPVSDEVLEALEKCRGAGIEIKMLTGDNVFTARAVAEELDMLDEKHSCVQASDIEGLADEELTEALKKISVIARSTPTLKMRIVRLLKKAGNVVAVTGDGINDAPAIKNADVGIAMGLAGTEVTKEACDIVLLDDSFGTIIRAVQWGRGIYENFRRFIQFQLTVNVSSVAVVICCVLAGFSAPFTALELLWINIIMDGPPALTLGLEPIREDLLNRPPTRRDDNILSKTVLTAIFINGIYISIVFMFQRFTNFLGAKPEEEATVLFTLFVLFQLFNAFNCRELGRESVFKNALSNRLMIGMFLLALMLQIVITQFGSAVFSTVPLDIVLWIKMFAAAFSVIVLDELQKAIKRALERR